MAVMIIPIVNAQIKLSDRDKFVFEFIQFDNEINATVQQINNTEFEIEIYALDIDSMKNNYKWYMALCNISGVDVVKVKNEDAQGGFNYSAEIETNYDYLGFYGLPMTWCPNTEYEGHILYSSGSKNDLPKKFRIIVPETAENFTIYAGDNSVQLEASPASQPLWDYDRDVCAIDSNGVLYCAWRGAGGNQYFDVYKRDTSGTWSQCTDIDLGAGSALSSINVMVNSSDHIIVFAGVAVGDTYITSSSDGCSTWDDVNAWTNAQFAPNWYERAGCDVMEVDGSDVVYCAFRDGGDDWHIGNYTGGVFSLSEITTDEVSNIDLVTYNGDICSFGVDLTTDDLDYMCASNGWARTEACAGCGAIEDDAGFYATVDSDGNVWVTWICTSDMWIANSSFNHIDSWSCQELETSSSDGAAISINTDNHIWIRNYQSETTDSNVWQYNSTDFSYGGTFSETTVSASQSVGKTGGQNYPSSAMPTNESWWIYDDNNDIYFDAWQFPYVAPAQNDTCTYTSGDWDIDCSDNCNIDTEVNLGSNNVNAYGSGYVRIGSSGKIELTTGSIYANCNVYCYNTDGCFG